MHLIDRHRSVQRVDVGGRRARVGQFCLVDHDRGGAGAELRRERHRIGLQRQLLALRTDDVELVMVASGRAGHEQFPVADAADPHRMPARIPEIEITDNADALRIRGEHDEADAIDAFELHRMGAELVIQPLMGAFAEQIEVEIAQDGGEAIGVIEIDDVVAIARAQLVVHCTIRHISNEQAGIVDALQRRGGAMLVNHIDCRGFRQEGANHGLIILLMAAEIVERVGVAAFDDGVSFRG